MLAFKDELTQRQAQFIERTASAAASAASGLENWAKAQTMLFVHLWLPPKSRTRLSSADLDKGTSQWPD